MLFAKSILTSILKVLDESIEKFRSSRNFYDWHLARMAFWDTAFFVVLEDKMVNLGPSFDNVNYGHKNFGQNSQFSHQNDQLVETNRMVLKAKLYLIIFN